MVGRERKKKADVWVERTKKGEEKNEDKT